MKKLIGIVLAALLLLSCMPLAALADGAQIGAVTVSIVDNGDRDYLLDYCDEEEMQYLEPFGVIVPETEVPIYEGDSAADALVRLFEMNGITYNAWGSPAYQGGFYLQNITFTAADGTLVENFGEGSITPDDEYMYYFSGWMVTLNNWFTSSGICDYYVEDGDIICMQYTCGMGADIGSDFSVQSAAITGIVTESGAVSPAFSADTKAYTLTVGSDTETVKLAVTNENYGSVVTYTAGDATYKYMRAIPVTNGTVITVNSKFYTSDYSTGETTLVDEDQITITVVKPEPEQPSDPGSVTETAKDLFQMLKDGITSLIGFFRNIFTRIADFFTDLANR